MPIPEGLDRSKLKETALALLSLGGLGGKAGRRAWKSLDWDVMDLLYQQWWISSPRSKAKSVLLTEEGARLASEFLKKHFQDK